MRFETTVFVFMCFFFCLCDGAPGGESNKKGKYSNEEKKFIATEVLSLLDEHKSMNSQSMWRKVGEKHREKWKRKADGFPYERTANSLRTQFHELVKNKHLQPEGIVPESLVQKLIQLHKQNTKRGLTRHRSNTYTPEEETVIFKELLKPSCESMFGLKSLEVILAKLEKKRQDKIRGFELERTIHSIRSHLQLLRERSQFPEEVVKKFPILQKEVPDNQLTLVPSTSRASNVSPAENITEASSSTAPSQIQRTDSQLSNEEQDEDDWIADMLKELR